MQAPNKLPRSQLQDVLDWAQARISAGDEPSWSRYQHVKLVEAIRTIVPDESRERPFEAMDQTPAKANDWPVSVLS